MAFVPLFVVQLFFIQPIIGPLFLNRSVQILDRKFANEFNILYLNSYFDGFNESGAMFAIAEKQIIDDELLPPNSLMNIRGQQSVCPNGRMIASSTMMLVNYIKDLKVENKTLNAVIGPGCSEEMVMLADMAAGLNIPVFAYMSTTAILNDRARFATLVRTSAGGKVFGHAILMAIAQYGWKKIAIITPITMIDLMPVVNQFLEEEINGNIEVTSTVFFTSIDDDEKLDARTLSLKANSRIIVVNTGAFCFKETLRVLESFARNGMDTQEYVYITYEQSVEFSQEEFTSGCVAQNLNNALLTSMFTRVMNINHDYGGVARLRDAYTERKMGMAANIKFSYTFSLPSALLAMYDTLYLWAIATNKTYSQGGIARTRDGRAMFQASTFHTFEGLLSNVSTDGDAEIRPSFIVNTVLPGGVNLRILRIIALHDGFTSDKQFGLYVSARLGYTFKHVAWNFWPGGLPQDTPDCGYGNCADYTLVYWIVSIVVGGALLTLLVVHTYYQRMFVQKHMKHMDMPWRMDFSQLITHVPKEKEGSMSMASSGDNSSSSSIPTYKSTKQQMAPSIEMEILLVDEKWRLCLYRNTQHLKAVTLQRSKKFVVHPKLLISLYELYNLVNDNLSRFIGLSDDPASLSIDLCFASCVRGSLKTVLYNKEMELDSVFRGSFCRDILRGLTAIHSSTVDYHGQLNIYNCVVNRNWTVKLTAYGLNPIYKLLMHDLPETVKKEELNIFTDQELLYMAPELLRTQRNASDAMTGNQAGDIYALGLVLYELIANESPFALKRREKTAEELLAQVRSGKKATSAAMKSMNSLGDITAFAPKLGMLIHDCVMEDPNDRPNLKYLTRHLTKALPKRSESIVGHMMHVMEKYAQNLEKVVEERTEQLEQSRRKADHLLYQMLPQTVAEALKLGKSVPPVTYPSTTICFCDIVGFTQLCSLSNPLQIVDMLNHLYKEFDTSIAANGVYKVETIGDAYMMAAGLFDPPGTNHARIMAKNILYMSQVASSLAVPHIPDRRMIIRAGFASGSIAGGVIGLQAPRFCLFGDTVNLASRMESTGQPGLVQITQESAVLLKNIPEYKTTLRGKVMVKGKGELETYWLSSTTSTGPSSVPSSLRTLPMVT